MSYRKFTTINTNMLGVKIKDKSDEVKNVDHDAEQIIKYINEKFYKIYQLGYKLAIDEGLIKYHDRHSFKGYMPQKPNKVAMEMYLCCDSSILLCVLYKCTLVQKKIK
ncbi:hypothetical protein CDIK_1337 [Cucumispora dikerogammari]|nr:hypothetical protein CDIK_1337 [Cucumispora dikerogammari]